MRNYTKDDIQEPTKEIIEEYIKEFNGQEKTNEDNVAMVFKAFNNDVLEHVLAKVVVLNSIYSADLRNIVNDKIPSKEVSVKKMAYYIWDNRSFFNNSGNNEDAVRDWITTAIQDFKGWIPYSFLTKYCAWSFQKLDIPIYDSHAKAMLFHINELYKYHDSFTKTKIENGDYKFYCEVYDKFANKRGNGKNYKDIDKYLWMYAKKHDIKLYPQKEKNSEGKV